MKRKAPEPPGCPCRCHYSHRARHDEWKPAHDRILTQQIKAGATAEAVAAALTTRFGIARTALAVRRRTRLLGLSTRDGWLSREDLHKALGISVRKLVVWEEAGLLPGNEFGRWRRYKWVDVEAFVREHVDLLDLRRIRNSRLGVLAQASSIKQRSAVA